MPVGRPAALIPTSSTPPWVFASAASVSASLAGPAFAGCESDALVGAGADEARKIV